MMEFKEFCDYVKDEVIKYLPPQFNDAEVSVNVIQKNNNTQLTGLTIRTEGCTISPNIYLDNYYAQYQHGMELDLVCEQIAMMHLKHMNPGEALADIVDNFQNVDFIKSHVVVSLINAEKNERMLEDTPHRLKEDLAIIYKVYLGSEGENVGTVTVKDSHMEMWGLTEPELYECAMKNSKELMPVEVEDIGTVLSEMGFQVGVPIMSEAPALYVISNKQRCNGAAGILYSDCLEQLSDKLGSDLYILPSSVHETLALSADGGKDVEMLAQMVREVNATQVSEQEQLSDHVYKYDAKAKTFSLADVAGKDLKVSEDKAKYETKNETRNAEAASARPRRHR
ncbi:MAG: DUF5688 family protein [Lachnospiraceae bacterium]|nr:DUF5688 family protein [Lachnospiraceae bacterium]